MRPCKQDYTIGGHWMLADLTEIMDEIESKNEWEYKFIESLQIRIEENPEYKLTNRQFNCLLKIHGKYRS